MGNYRRTMAAPQRLATSAAACPLANAVRTSSAAGIADEADRVETLASFQDEGTQRSVYCVTVMRGRFPRSTTRVSPAGTVTVSIGSEPQISRQKNPNVQAPSAS